MIVGSEASAQAEEAFLKKVDEIHQAVLHLAASYGIFHGMNDAFGGRSIAPRKASHAIGVIQYDLVNVLVVRLCALCEQGGMAKPDDASMAVLMKEIDNQALRDRLAEKDRRWSRALLSRSPKYRDARSNVAILMERWEKLQSVGESLRRIRHLRNKKIGHVTIGFEKEDLVLFQELWTLIEHTFDLAESIQLVLAGTEYRYRAVVDSHKEDGRALIEALCRSRGDAPVGTQ